jgi:hypothetical protein
MNLDHARPLRRAIFAAAAAGIAASGIFFMTEQSSGAEASTCPSTTLTRTGVQTAGVYRDNNGGSWNLAGASWANGAGGNYPIRSEAWTRGCVVGGSFTGRIPRTATRDVWYNGIGGSKVGNGDVYRQTLTPGDTNYLYVKDAFASDHEDAYDPNGTASAQMVTLDHVRAEYMRDDCYENEGSVVASTTITNTLFDGCFTAFAERPSGASTVQNGTGAASFTVQDSLVYAIPQPLGPQYCSSTGVTRGRCKATARSDVWLGSYGIWKWSTKAASHVTVRNTIFRLDMPSYSSCASQRWPAGTYENVTLVWTGAQPYATAGDCTNVLPAGVTLTRDVKVWNDAKAAWLARGTTAATAAR